MGKDSEDLLSLPSPPPPRPAARRDAIETALHKFDGIEEASAKPAPSRIRWATIHRRPAGALVAATLIAVVAIPAIQIALRDHPPEAASEEREPRTVQPDRDAGPGRPISKAPQPGPDQAAVPETRPSTVERSTPASMVAEDLQDFTSTDSEQKAGFAAPPPVMAGPAASPLVSAQPPPPPPPPPAAKPRAEPAETGSIVVTGSRVRRQNLESASPVTIIDPDDEFLSRLQAGLGTNDRRAVIRLVAMPLRVNFDGGVRTYRSSRDVERDFDRIFTASVRQAALNLHPDTLMIRDGGRLKGNGPIWFGCGKSSCSSASAIRIREVIP